MAVMDKALDTETKKEGVLPKDYSLVGKNTQKAIDSGLAEADWYLSPVSKEDMRDLLTRKDLPAIRDCIIYFGLIAGAAYMTLQLWGSWWAVIPMMIYGVLYASASDSRWHESSHGTAFKTDWMNNLLYEISSFMVLRESVPWRWSHTRHHSDTIIVGRDPEIAVPRPPSIREMFLKCVNFQAFRRYVYNITIHCFGKLTPAEASFIPKEERPAVYFRARIYALIYLGIFSLCYYYGTWLPLVFVLGPNIYGAWLMPIYGWTQHAGLAEDVLDHRLNCRTIHMNFINRFLYWNMNYHTEHHMFPMVPYHQLPRLHALIKDDCPEVYPSLWSAYKEIIPAVLKQVKDPAYYVKRTLPASARPFGYTESEDSIQQSDKPIVNGWVEVCDANELAPEDVVRFDHSAKTFAVYRTKDGEFYASDGICTHGNTHLSTGLVKGKLVECPKHNGRFNLKDGSPARAPACVALKTYPVKTEGGKIYMNIEAAGGCGAKEKTYRFKVKSNRNVATFIKELVLEAEEGQDLPEFKAGQYMQLNIPSYENISFSDFEVSEPYASVWKAQHVYENTAENKHETRRNYSLACNPSDKGGEFRFNVRIATPPRGLDCKAGVGSSYVYSLKEGDTVTAIGPFGDFLIKETDREMLYLGGGAGMAPMRSHLSHLFETLKTGRKVSYWYGARSAQEIFYDDYFRGLEKEFPNFSYNIALSEPLDEDQWSGHTGFIHEVLKKNYLDGHTDPKAIEYYLCGPPMMMRAAQDMLNNDFDINPDDISLDEF